MSHSAVLLAGGKSSRMGRDKAVLRVGGVPLWRRQMERLKATHSSELFLSTAKPGDFAGDGEAWVILPDAFPECGPLGAIATAMGRAQSALLLVLAVDMPAMTAGFLLGISERAKREGRGIIPRSRAGFREPLAAVYPCSELAIARQLLEAGARRMDTFVEALIARGTARMLDLTADEEALFENWNEPKDVREIPLP